MKPIRKETDSTTSKAKVIGTLLLSQFFLCFALTDLGLLFGISPKVSFLPAALLLPVLTVLLLVRERKEAAIAGAWTLLVWGLAVAVAIPMRDSSADGNVYHQEIVAALCNGWIPGGANPSGLELCVWSLHYAKGLEIAAATVVKAIGFLEAGKAVNIILCLIPGFLDYAFCSRFFPAISPKGKFMIAVSAVCNPVCMMQVLTYYIDFAKYVYSISGIILLIEWCTHRSRGTLLMLAMVIIMAAATKFNAFFEIGVVCFAAILWLLVRRRTGDAVRLALFCSVCAAVAVIIFCRHPYITNYLTAGHPLYPLMGEGAIDIMTGNTPAEFADGNRFTNFFRSLFCITRLGTDSRHGGFGFLMVPLLILALATVWKSRRLVPGGSLSLYIAAWVFGSCFFFEQSWWARYICQLWILIPLSLTLALANAATATGGRRLLSWRTDAVAIKILVVLSVLFCGFTMLVLSLRVTLYRHVIKTSLQGDTVCVHGLRESYLRQMTEVGITPVATDSIDPHSYHIPYHGPLSLPDNYPVMLLDSAKGEALRKEINQLPFDYSPLFETAAEMKMP